MNLPPEGPYRVGAEPSGQECSSTSVYESPDNVTDIRQYRQRRIARQACDSSVQHPGYTQALRHRAAKRAFDRLKNHHPGDDAPA